MSFYSLPSLTISFSLLFFGNLTSPSINKSSMLPVTVSRHVFLFTKSSYYLVVLANQNSGFTHMQQLHFAARQVCTRVENARHSFSTFFAVMLQDQSEDFVAPITVPKISSEYFKKVQIINTSASWVRPGTCWSFKKDMNDNSPERKKHLACQRILKN